MALTRVYPEGRKLSLAVGSGVVSDDLVLVGSMVGVALTDYGESKAGEATLDFGGVWLLSVKGVDDAGNVAVAVGDPLYYVTGDTPVLSKKSTGVFVGYAIAVVNSGATTTIAVKLVEGAQGDSYFGSGIAVSTEITGNGSAQNFAHGFGTVPSRVVVAPTTIASGVNYAVTEGSHTTTNAIVTVTTGVKYKVIAFK